MEPALDPAQPAVPHHRVAVVGTGFSGLGMAIAKTIVQNHGGHIELRDRQPAGLRVAITLPIMGTESGCAS